MLLDQAKCEVAVREYRLQKECFERHRENVCGSSRQGIVTGSNRIQNQSTKDSKAMLQQKVAEYIGHDDVVRIEDFLLTWKGVPGYAAMRKRAKGAVKKIKERENSTKI